MLLEPENHIELHTKAARYHAAVLLYHLRKCEQPFIDLPIPAPGVFDVNSGLSRTDVQEICSKLSGLENN